MTVPHVLLVIAIVWLLSVAVFRLLLAPLWRRGPGDSAVTGFMWWICIVYCRLVHRVRHAGTGILPKSDSDHEGLIVVSNHTCSVDPLLIQSACRFWIRWMMASDMMSADLDWLWKQQRLIPVDRDGQDSRALREAIRHVRSGGCLGIFPEGRLVLPPEQIRPFFTGIGFLIAKTKAPVLVVWLSGTPSLPGMTQALFTPSRSRVQFLDLIDFSGESDPQVITDRLREMIHEASGWPYNDEILPPGGVSEAD